MFYAIRSSKIRGSKWALAVKIENFRKFRRHCFRLPVISWESKWRGWTGERHRKDHGWRLFSTTRWAVEDGLSGIDYPMWIVWYQPSIELHFWGPPSEEVQWLMIHQLRCGNLVFNLVMNLQLQRKSYTNLDKWMKIPSNLNMWYPIKQVKIDTWFFGWIVIRSWDLSVSLLHIKADDFQNIFIDRLGQGNDIPVGRERHLQRGSRFPVPSTPKRICRLVMQLGFWDIIVQFFLHRTYKYSSLVSSILHYLSHHPHAAQQSLCLPASFPISAERQQWSRPSSWSSPMGYKEAW